jgi:hypothetical protein
MLGAVLLLLGHTISRKTAALAGLAFLAAAPRPAAAQAPVNPADAAWREDRGRAPAIYEAQVRAGEGGDTTLFNAGAAALAVGDTALARRALGLSARSLEPDIRFRALFDLGLYHHYLARIEPANAEVHYANARAAYIEALLLRPGDQDAKWNLELAIENAPPSDNDQSNPDPPPPPEEGSGDEESRSGLSPSQAEQILNSILEEERETRERMNDRRNLSREILREKEW